jgi:site-specific DNA recombinase
MKAAIYARKSTDDKDRNPENRSTDRQIKRAREYAQKKGWKVADEHIYKDEALSGADFHRPGLLRMLAALTEFDVIVISELSRLGREQNNIGVTLGKIHRKGVQVHCYLTGGELKYKSAMDKAIANMYAVYAELERELLSQRVRDALRLRAEKGQNTGGRVYGYDNCWIKGGRRVLAPFGKKKVPKDDTRTEYKINKQQADVIRRIFRMYADGFGHPTIAKTLNGDSRHKKLSRKYFDGRRPPSSKKGTGSWAPSSVREILYRERYVGIVPWGEYQNELERDEATGKKIRTKQVEYLKPYRAELRIIDDDLWQQVQKRLKSVRETYIRDTNGNLWGRPAAGRESKYLLSGIARCGLCGGPISALSGGSGRGQRIAYYMCSYHHNRGNTVCKNDHREWIERLDAPVLEAIEETALGPADARALNADIAREERELDNLLALAAAGGKSKSPRSLLEAIKSKEQLLDSMRADLASQEVPLDLSELDERRLRKALEAKVGQFKDNMHSNVPKGRQVLGKLLLDLHFVPEVQGGRKTYRFHGRTDLGPIVGQAFINLASPRGFEPLLPP